MLSDRPRVRDFVDALDRGAKDDRVVGLVATISSVPMGMAEAQEVRDAVLRFRVKKKFAIAYSETFGEFGPGNGAYYIATAFDQIYLQPSGDVGLTGLMIETQFLKGTLDKLGVKFHGDHRYEYKNAFNIYTETKYTDAHKEANSKVMNSWFGQMKSGICEARHLDKFRRGHVRLCLQQDMHVVLDILSIREPRVVLREWEAEAQGIVERIAR